ncbi:MAG: hypothetical protein HY876_10060 [Coriobacteriales bacterium]|nr:hypothetical protein [Coriobacteriales bacterium]
MYVTENWGCANGHSWDQVSGWYDPDTGQQITPYWLASAPAAEAPAVQAAEPAIEPHVAFDSEPTSAVEPTPDGPRVALLAALLTALQANQAYEAQYGTDTDIVVTASPLSANWGVGGKRVDYSAIMKAVEGERTLYFWEMLKEQGGGLSFGGVQTESYSTFGTKRSGKTSETIVTPGGVEQWSWDYGATRQLVESVAAEHSWRVKTVLRKKSAQW